jgi:3-hydroxyisobutyrate dehydrogenase-like beta-hydroxyacid dehydrogenase
MRVAVLGLGRMGSAIARRLEEAGHELAVWNRSPGRAEEFAERGVRVLAEPEEALREADVVITMLADGAAVESVVGAVVESGGGEEGGEARSTLIDMSTISVDSSARVAAACEQAGVDYLRAPVSGNPGVVAAGNLGIVVSGPPEVFDANRALLADIGPKVWHVGPDEQARVVKLALNLMLGGTAQLMAEALVLGERHGISRRDMLDVIGGSALGSPFVAYKTDALVADDYSTTFSASLLYKDLHLALDTANEAGVPLPLTAATEQLVQACISLGMGEDDLTALLPRLRREAGLD